MEVLLDKINILRHLHGKPFIITSGYRPAAHNAAIGGATKSAHMTCQAIDILDTDNVRMDWLVENQDILEDLDLYMESGNYTPTWVHLQTRPTRSGNRIFIP